MLAEPVGRQSERDRVERELFLRAMLGGKLPAAREMAEQLRGRTLEAGEFLYRAGDLANEVYFVVQGTIGLSRPGGPEREFGPGSMLGIFDVEHDRPRVRTARALSKVELLALSAEDRLELLEDSFEQTRAVIRRMAARLDELGQYGGQPLEPTQTLAPKEEALPLIERVFTLRDTPAFRRASIQALVSLAPAADEVALGAGEVLFQQGEARGVLYVVVAGCLELIRADGALERYASATLVGGGAALGDGLLRQSARALTPAVVLRLREEDLYDVMEDHFELARSVMRYLSTEHEQQLEAAEAAQTPVLKA
ncbi:MAG: hypothetical protein RL033_4876 [Pseudomonadota bacterium]|jgi:CRP-like cAMP-binding protein